MTATKKKGSKKALPFKRSNTFLAYPEDLYLETRPGHKHYDTRVHLEPEEHVVKGIMRDGVQDAVFVEKFGDKVIVVSGRQRTLAAIEANRRLVAEGQPRRMIPVAPKRGDASTLMRIDMLTNFHRRAETPCSEAHKIAQYMNLGHNEDDVAELLGYDVQTVKRRLKLLELCPEVQAALDAGKITQGKALSLCNKSPEDQLKALNAKPRKKKDAPRKPTKALVKKVVEANGDVSDQVKAAILWGRGEITEDEAKKRIPGLEKVLA